MHGFQLWAVGEGGAGDVKKKSVTSYTYGPFIKKHRCYATN